MAIETPGYSGHYDGLVKDMQASFGRRQGLFLANRIAKAIRQIDDFCMSHFRVARADHPLEVARYVATRADGC